MNKDIIIFIGIIPLIIFLCIIMFGVFGWFDILDYEKHVPFWIIGSFSWLFIFLHISDKGD